MNYAQERLGKHFGKEPLSWWLKVAGVILPPIIDYIDKILTRNSKLKDIELLVKNFPVSYPAGPLIESIENVLKK